MTVCQTIRLPGEVLRRGATRSIRPERRLRSAPRFGMSLSQWAGLYREDPAFRAEMASGRYLRQGERFWLRTAFRSGRLTQKALASPQDWCLGARETVSPFRPKLPAGVAARSTGTRVRMQLQVPPEVLTLASRAEQNTALLRSLPGDFGGTVQAHIRRRGMTRAALAEVLSLSEKTLYRLLSGGDGLPRRDLVIALCAALRLDGRLNEDLLRKAGYTLRDTDRDAVLDFLLRVSPLPTLREFNQVLAAEGYAPLTDPGKR